MKKIISTILVCTLLLGCLFTLTSCFGPNSDPEKAKTALEDAGYLVTLTDNDLALALSGYEGLSAKIYAAKVSLGGGLDFDGITIYYFEDKESADNAYDKIVGESEEQEDDEDATFTVGKFMKVIWFGTEAAIEAAK